MPRPKYPPGTFFSLRGLGRGIRRSRVQEWIAFSGVTLLAFGLAFLAKSRWDASDWLSAVEVILVAAFAIFLALGLVSEVGRVEVSEVASPPASPGQSGPLSSRLDRGMKAALCKEAWLRINFRLNSVSPFAWLCIVFIFGLNAVPTLVE